MAIGSNATLNTATVTGATEVELRVIYRPIEDDITMTPVVGSLVGDAVSYTTDEEKVITGPATSTLTSMTVEITDYAALKDMLRFNYNGYLVERFSLAVSGP
jgi:hypothetical protein